MKEIIIKIIARRIKRLAMQSVYYRHTDNVRKSKRYQKRIVRLLLLSDRLGYEFDRDKFTFKKK